MKAGRDEREVEESQDDSQSHVRRKPQITEILDNQVNIGSSSSSLVDAISVYRNLQEFPIMAFSNEPVSHLANAEVRKALKTLPDKIHRDCQAGDALHHASANQCAFETSVPARGHLNVSPPIEIKTVAVNDGDGIIIGVNPNSDTPLQNARYTRLNRVDAPELFAIHYVRNESTNQVLEQFKGHLSLLGLQFFLDLFVRKGTAKFTYGLTRAGRSEPKDCYGRPLKEFWFSFTSSPADRELRILDNINRICADLQPEEKLVLMSPFNPRLATEERPFYLNLNALLVISGNCHVFTRFCQDQRMLALQQLAKENQIGPLYCGITRNHVIGCEINISEDVVLSQFSSLNVDRMRLEGYPDWITQGNRLVGLLPWHERSLKRQVYSFNRQKAREHLVTPRNVTSPVYGMYIDIDR